MRYLIFIVISLGLLLSSISGTSVAVAFPSIIDSFGTNLITAGWVISIYQIALTIMMPLMGKLSDIIGRKTTFILCVVMFIVGSFLSAIAPSIGVLIAARFIQAIGGGGFMPSATGIISEEFPESRQKAIGLFSSIFPIGQLLGPNIGGWLISKFSWRSVFWINIPFGIVVLMLSIFLLRKDNKVGGKIDFKGATYLSVFLSALLAGLSVIGSSINATSITIASLLIIGSGIFFVLFVKEEKSSSEPILDFEVLKSPPFAAANIFNFIYGMGIIGVMSLIPTFAVTVYDMNVFESGFILTPRSIAMIVTSFLVSLYLDKWGYRWPMIFGTVVTTISLILLGIEPHNLELFGFSIGNMSIMLTIMAIAGLGVGASAPASNNACIELMPERVATITGVRGMFRQSGGAISMTIATIVLHQFTNLASGFKVIFIALAILTVLSIPVIFIMPSSSKPTRMASKIDLNEACEMKSNY